MFEVTKENFHIFLTHHGMNVENAQVVVEKWYNTDNYRNMLSVRLWVDASKMLLRTVEI